MSSRASATRIVMAAALVSMTGCATSPFYNETRDKQGQALTAAVAKIDLLPSVAAVEGKFTALRVLEVETHKARMATNRDMEIAQLFAPALDDNKVSLKDRYVDALLKARLQQLLGEVPANEEIDKLLGDAAVDLTVRDLQRSRINAFNARTGLNVADCAAAFQLADETGALRNAALGSRPQKQQQGAGALFSLVMRECKRGGEFKLTPKAGSVLHVYTDRRNEAKGRLGTYREAVEKSRNQLRTESADVDQMVAALEPRSGDATASAQLAQGATAAASAVGALGHALALEQSDSLDQVLAILSSGATDLSKLSADDRRAVRSIRLIPSLADDADKLLKDAARPRLAPMILAREQLRLAVEGYTAKQALLERQLALREEQVEAALDEAGAIGRALRVLGPPPQGKRGATVNAGLAIKDAMADSGEDGRRRVALYESLAYAFDHATHHRERHELLEFTINGIADDMVMLQSRSAAKQWTSLLQHMAAALAEHHAAGIKPADLAEFLKGFGLVFIGQRAGN